MKQDFKLRIQFLKWFQELILNREPAAAVPPQESPIKSVGQITECRITAEDPNSFYHVQEK